jgi:hypothetical protein
MKNQALASHPDVEEQGLNRGRLTESTCMPHPAQEGFPQELQATLRHMSEICSQRMIGVCCRVRQSRQYTTHINNTNTEYNQEPPESGQKEKVIFQVNLFVRADIKQCDTPQRQNCWSLLDF